MPEGADAMTATAHTLDGQEPDSVDLRWTGIAWLVVVVENGAPSERAFIAETFAKEFAVAERERLGLSAIGRPRAPLG